MPRRLRIQYPGALYHIINRGNYRQDLFGTAGAAQAFEAALDEACRRHAWIIHAFAIMRNHFHLALETPEPNLVDGMHWLQSTYATRFNRYRSELGHVFQGRYKSPLVEDDAALVRVIDYLHLNPVRAGIVTPDRIATFRWSSLSRFVAGPRPPWLSPARLLAHFGIDDSRGGWAEYIGHLQSLARDPKEQNRLGFDRLSSDWAIGTDGWRRALAREHTHLALIPDLERAEIQELREARWNAILREILRSERKSGTDVVHEPKGARWKVRIARQLRREAGASYRWITEQLNTLQPASLRVAVSRLDNM
jgi:putative transposase